MYLIAMVVLAWAAVLIGAYRHLPVVSRGTSAGNGRSLDVSAAAADVESHHRRLALAWEWNGRSTSRGSLRSRSPWSRSFSSGMAATSEITGNFGPRCSVFAAASFVAAGIAGFFGAMINKYAPVHGGHTIQIRRGEEK